MKKRVKNKPLKKVSKMNKSVRKKTVRKEKKSKSKKIKTKKVVRKIIKKKTLRRVKKINKKVNNVSKKDFEAFSFGIQRLNELRKELNSLDTRGFNKEDKAIRSKLRNVSEVPNIERDIKVLKSKINRRYNPKKKKTSAVKKELRAIKEDIPELKEEIKKLGRRRDIPELKEEIKKLGRRRDIPELKEQIEKLSKKSSSIKSDIPELKSEIERLGKKITFSKRKKLKSIDSGVGMLVDTDFNNFLNHIKVSLSNRVKEREQEVDDTLKIDLQKRESKFRDKYSGLAREFNERKRKLEQEYGRKYSTKVKTSLQREVSEKFNEELKKKLNSEKVNLGKKYVSELKDHARINLERHKQTLKNKLKEELARKIKSLESQFGKKIIEEDIERKRLQKSKQDFVLQKEEERRRIRDKIVNESHKKLETELSKREKIIRVQLRNEFELKLKKQIQTHEAELKKRKLDLELEMQKKIKQVLN